MRRPSRRHCWSAPISADSACNSACNIGEAEALNAIMGWTMFQPRREQWTRQRYQRAPPESLRSRPQLENEGAGVRFAALDEPAVECLEGGVQV